MKHWVLRLGLLLGLLLLVVGISSPPMGAVILRHQEGLGQMLYQSRQTLRDPRGNSWQAIVFKRTQPDGESNLVLRLVGFPGTVALDHPCPLTIVSSLGQKFTTTDITDRILTEEDISNVGQYDLQPVIWSLRPELPIKLSLETQENAKISLFVSSRVIQEWLQVAAASGA